MHTVPIQYVHTSDNYVGTRRVAISDREERKCPSVFNTVTEVWALSICLTKKQHVLLEFFKLKQII